jgi:hypothetical protein
MSLRSFSVAPWLIGLGSVALLGFAGYSAWDATRAPAVRVEVPDLVMDGASVGANTVEYVLVNDSSEPVQLLGGDAHCFAGCCYGPKLDDLPTIPPGGRAVVPYEVNVRQAGEPFAAESTLFLLWRGRLEKLKVTVSGTAAAASPGAEPAVSP